MKKSIVKTAAGLAIVSGLAITGAGVLANANNKDSKELNDEKTLSFADKSSVNAVTEAKKAVKSAEAKVETANQAVTDAQKQVKTAEAKVESANKANEEAKSKAEATKKEAEKAASNQKAAEKALKNADNAALEANKAKEAAEAELRAAKTDAERKAAQAKAQAAAAKAEKAAQAQKEAAAQKAAAEEAAKKAQEEAQKAEEARKNAEAQKLAAEQKAKEAKALEEQKTREAEEAKKAAEEAQRKAEEAERIKQAEAEANKITKQAAKQAVSSKASANSSVAQNQQAEETEGNNGSFTPDQWQKIQEALEKDAKTRAEEEAKKAQAEAEAKAQREAEAKAKAEAEERARKEREAWEADIQKQSEVVNGHGTYDRYYDFTGTPSVPSISEEEKRIQSLHRVIAKVESIVSTESTITVNKNIKESDSGYIWWVETSCDLSRCVGFNAHSGSGKVSVRLDGTRADNPTMKFTAPEAKAGYKFVGWKKYVVKYDNDMIFEGYEAVYDVYVAD